MSWLKERVWQMGIGALLALGGALLVYPATITETGNPVYLWVGLSLIFIGLAIPLLTRFVEIRQEEQGEEGEG